jgi:hypothetical protein
MGVNTGMISYSFAEFAAIVYNSPNLAGYKAKAAVYLQAAKDAVAFHDYEWVDNGSTGYYVFKKGAPYWTDGANLPHNQYLALARTQLAIYQATGDKFYYDRVKKMAQLFKNNLTVDKNTGAYIWYYQWGIGLNGWTSSDNISMNKPSYGGYKRFEDVSHGAIDVDFAYKAYKAGIVFTEEDLVRFGKTVEKFLILPGGKVASFVNGGVEAKYQIMIAHWLRISKYAPSAYPIAEKIVTGLTGAGGSGMLAIAMVNLAANNGGVIKPGQSGENPTPPPTPPATGDNELVNGGFDQSRTGWSGSLGTIRTESGGNKYLSNGYNWQAYQDLRLVAGEYRLSGMTKKMTAGTEARIVVRYTDAKGQFSYDNLLHKHKGSGWEQVEKTLTVPPGTTSVRVYLLVNGGTGEHGFDNLVLQSQGAGQTPKPTPPADTTAPQVTMTAPLEGSLLRGKIELKANASDDRGVVGLTFEYSGGDGKWSSLAGTKSGQVWTAGLDTATLSDGTYQFRAQAVDEAGNRGTAKQIQVRIDNTAPEIKLTTNRDLVISADGKESAAIGYQLTETAKVSLMVKDAQGKRVTVLQDRVDLNPGEHSVAWDGKAEGSLLPPGKYVYTVEAVDQAGNQSSTLSGTIELKPVPQQLLHNGGFDQNRAGWAGRLGTIRTEGNGNKYFSNGYNWQAYQDLKLTAGEYRLSGMTKRMTAGTEARIVARYTDAKGQFSYENLLHQHKGSGWEKMTKTFTVPAGTTSVRIYLLVNGGKGEHAFDNLSLESA